MRAVTSGRAAAVAAAALTAMLPGGASGQDPVEEDSIRVYLLEPVIVQGRVDDLTGLASAASVGYVGRRDLMARPLSREGELLEGIPGMILTQHSGEGKSQQMFVRGFNLDHGTDFSTRLEGMPLNIPTHAHGQGYTDINFIIPELVDHYEYSLGNYYAEIGDFGSAGGAEFHLRRSLAEPLFATEVGQNGQRRVVAAASIGEIGGSGSLLAGGEVRRYDGPWDVPERLRKLSGMLRYARSGPTDDFSLLFLGYGNSWNASDQIPLRAVESGALRRFGQVDSSLGGETSRYSLAARWSRTAEASSFAVSGFVSRYDLDLFSNFTYLLDDPAAGDQFRQEDDGRWTFGATSEYARILPVRGREHELSVGAEARADRAELTLSRTRNRAPLAIVRHDDVSQWSTSVYAELKSPWSDAFRTVIGLRGDLHRFDVNSDRAANTGTALAGIQSPKASLIFTPSMETEVYVSGGLGFHSNDARGAVATMDPLTGDPTDPVDPLVRSWGSELGIRASVLPGLRSTLALWRIDLDSELLFVGDVGTTAASDPSRRVGVTLANFYRISGAWSADLDVSLTRSRFRDVDPSSVHVPGAMSHVVATGLSYAPAGRGPFGSVRVRRFGSYPLVEDNSRRAPSSSLFNLRLGYQLGSLRVAATLLNALNATGSDVQYFYASRLGGEAAAGVEDVHFHPVEPRQIRLTVSWGL